MGAVLCGGQSKRFGSDKAVTELLSGRLLAQAPIDALRLAGIDPVVAVGGNFSAQLGVPTIADRWAGQGPLAGLATALLYATQSHVVATPCDVPLLRAEHVSLLTEACLADPAGDVAVVAEVNGQVEPSLGVWPSSWGRPLITEIRSGRLRLRHVLNVGPFRTVTVPAEAIGDADTPEELEALINKDYKPTQSRSAEFE